MVVAHLSEGIPRYWLLDNSSLETFVDNELEYGMQTAVEAKVLADVNATSGIQTQAYATSVLTTLRKGLTKLETAGAGTRSSGGRRVARRCSTALPARCRRWRTPSA